MLRFIQSIIVMWVFLVTMMLLYVGLYWLYWGQLPPLR